MESRLNVKLLLKYDGFHPVPGIILGKYNKRELFVPLSRRTKLVSAYYLIYYRIVCQLIPKGNRPFVELIYDCSKKLKS